MGVNRTFVLSVRDRKPTRLRLHNAALQRFRRIHGPSRVWEEGDSGGERASSEWWSEKSAKPAKLACTCTSSPLWDRPNPLGVSGGRLGDFPGSSGLDQAVWPCFMQVICNQ